MTAALQVLARDEITRCADKLRAAGRHVVEPDAIQVLCDLRGRSRAGLALPWLFRIRLSPDYFAALGDLYRSTIAHEYAHLVKYAEEHLRGYRRSPAHGRHWQAIMRALGYPPERVLSDEHRALAVSVKPARRIKLFVYTGANCTHVHKLGKVRHERAQAGAKFLCASGACKYMPVDQRGIAFSHVEGV